MSLGRSVGDSEREGVGSIEIGSNLAEGLGQADWTHASTVYVDVCVLCVCSVVCSHVCTFS